MEIFLASHSSADAATRRLHFPNGYLLLDFYQDCLNLIQSFICVGRGSGSPVFNSATLVLPSGIVYLTLPRWITYTTADGWECIGVLSPLDGA